MFYIYKHRVLGASDLQAFDDKKGTECYFQSLFISQLFRV